MLANAAGVFCLWPVCYFAVGLMQVCTMPPGRGGGGEDLKLISLSKDLNYHKLCDPKTEVIFISSH